MTENRPVLAWGPGPGEGTDCKREQGNILDDGNGLYFHCDGWVHDCVRLLKFGVPVLKMDEFLYFKPGKVW